MAMTPFAQVTGPMIEVMGAGEHIGYTRIDVTNTGPPVPQPAGGYGPVLPVPVTDDRLWQELAATNELLRELITVLASAMSP